jgi:hypothetical protein
VAELLAAWALVAAFVLQDPAITESSGLVVVDGRVVTVNDSGGTGRVFTVDPGTGGTVGTTTWASDPVDVEALAPAGADLVWVADIGDNRGERDEVSVLRVPVGTGEGSVTPTPVRMRYPDGGRDAEALLAHPLTGRLFVVTKGIFGGEVLAAPGTLRPGRSHRLEPVAGAPGLVTDGAFLPGGGAVVLRTYSRAVVLAYPSWEPVASWELPRQEQGEGLAVAGTDLLLSSEGVRSGVLREPLPAEALAADVYGSPAWAALRLLPFALAG